MVTYKQPSDNQESLRYVRVLGPNIFKGEMFLVKTPTEGKAISEDAQEVAAVDCTPEKYAYAESSSSCTMAARRLLDGVFTEKAIASCSMSGMPPRGKGRAAYIDPSNIRPHLCPKAVNAIIDLALKWQKSKHWHPKRDRSQIRQALAVRAHEIREKFAQPKGNEKGNE